MSELHNLKGLAVLVIDDEIAALDTMEQALQGVGAEVSRAQNIKQALAAIGNNAIDIIIAALDLVNEQCIEMIKDYKLRYPSCLFYVLTDEEYESVETSQESVKYIVDDYIKKPLDIARFVVMIETSMGRTIGKQVIDELQVEIIAVVRVSRGDFVTNGKRIKSAHATVVLHRAPDGRREVGRVHAVTRHSRIAVMIAVAAIGRVTVRRLGVGQVTGGIPEETVKR